MQINIRTVEAITIAELIGDIDGKTAPEAQEHLLPLLKDSCKLIFDMSEVGYMSSAGLRVLLSVRRQIPANGKLVLTGLSEQIHDTMSITGFVDFYTICETMDEAKQALEEVLR